MTQDGIRESFCYEHERHDRKPQHPRITTGKSTGRFQLLSVSAGCAAGQDRAPTPLAVLGLSASERAMPHTSRREFLKTGAAAAALPVLGTTVVAAPAKRSATDLVTLRRSNVQVTRLAFGTGTHGGRVQRELGQAEFTRLVRHAYDRGIRFFETA